MEFFKKIFMDTTQNQLPQIEAKTSFDSKNREVSLSINEDNIIQVEKPSTNACYFFKAGEEKSALEVFDFLIMCSQN